MKKKEIFWFIGTLTFTQILIIWVFGVDVFTSDTGIDINYYDSYLVIPSKHLIILSIALIFFGVYLFRMLKSNFKNKIVNLISMISMSILIFYFTFLIGMVSNLREAPGMTIYPPLSGIDPIEHEGNVWNSIYNSLIFAQLSLIILLGFVGIRTDFNYKKDE